jgi:CRP/FNR family transcriptional activator FtrB
MPAASLFDEPYLNSARTLAPCRLLQLRAEVAREEFERCGRFTFNISRIMAGHFRLATRQIIDLKSRSAPQRLADFLLRIADASGNGDVADLPLPKRNLARRIGMTPETLSRNLQVLADNGLLVRGTKILVRDRAKIIAFCGPPPYPDQAEEGLAVHML